MRHYLIELTEAQLEWLKEQLYRIEQEQPGEAATAQPIRYALIAALYERPDQYGSAAQELHAIQQAARNEAAMAAYAQEPDAHRRFNAAFQAAHAVHGCQPADREKAIAAAVYAARQADTATHARRSREQTPFERAMVPPEPYPLIQYKQGRTHAANAGGSHLDGSLIHFYTVCDRYIADIADWSERDDLQLTCGNCRAILERNQGNDPRATATLAAYPTTQQEREHDANTDD